MPRAFEPLALWRYNLHTVKSTCLHTRFNELTKVHSWATTIFTRIYTLPESSLVPLCNQPALLHLQVTATLLPSEATVSTRLLWNHRLMESCPRGLRQRIPEDLCPGLLLGRWGMGGVRRGLTVASAAFPRFLTVRGRSQVPLWSAGSPPLPYVYWVVDLMTEL